MVPQPTVFISYASEDRSAVLLLRDALAAAGLDVWLDENELGGGDAWDQKIRRQIRECDYFMPVISATTERRKEGYFRREWRLAAERTLDMADDVMFLLPVVIDGTSDAGARVPEKFVTVQWLRVPGGAPTPALEVLAKRLATGDHSLPPKLAANPPLLRKGRAAEAEPGHDGPPPMPPFPHLAEKGNIGHGLKFFAEVIWWVITAGWLLLRRAPRWVRVILSIWLCIWLVAQCSRSTSEARSGSKSSAAKDAEARQAVKKVAEKFATLVKPADGSDPGANSKLAALGSQLAQNIAAGIQESGLAGKPLVAVPFALGVTKEDDAKFLTAVFTPLYGRLAVERPGETGLASQPLTAATTDELVALGRRLEVHYVLGAQLTTEDGESVLKVRLVKTNAAAVVWSADYPVDDADPAAVAEQIGTGVLATLPR